MNGPANRSAEQFLRTAAHLLLQVARTVWRRLTAFFTWIGKRINAQTLTGLVFASLVALTINGLVHIPQQIAHGVNSVGRIFHSDVENTVNDFYASEKKSSFWLTPPALSETSKQFLLSHWDQSRPDRAHASEPLQPEEKVEPDELAQDVSLDGKWIEVFGYVSQVLRITRVSSNDDLVKERLRLGTGENSAVVWCATTVKRGQEYQLNQPINAVGVAVARGSAKTADGGFDNGTLMVCPHIEPLANAQDSQEATRWFDTESSSSFWSGQPTLTDRRLFVMSHWSDLSPYRVHPYWSGKVSKVPLDEVITNRSLDAKFVLAEGYVNSVEASNAGAGRVFEFFELTAGDPTAHVWCSTTTPKRHVVHRDDYVRIVGAVIARGAAALSTGGFERTATMVCPSVYRSP
jgi:hypothetical protein